MLAANLMKKSYLIAVSCPMHTWEIGGLLTRGSLFNIFWITLESPVKLEGKQQFSMDEDVHHRKNSNVRVHVEKGIRRVKVFKILQGNIPLLYLHLISKLWMVCCWA